MALDGKYGKLDIPGIPDDEPVFIIRGQDKAAVDAIISYGDHAGVQGATNEFCDSVTRRSDEFAEWQESHLDAVKVPD